VAEEVEITEVDGPRGRAVIYEVTLPGGQIIEVEYSVRFAGERRSVQSLGEAHLLANQLTGLDDES
jgi:hypothetical protein